MHAKELMEMISPEEIIEFLEQRYDLHPYRNNEKEARFQTVCHGGDSHKLYFYKNTKLFFCYTNCGTISLFDLVMLLEDCDFYPAFQIISGFFDMNMEETFYVSDEEPIPSISTPVEIPELPEKRYPQFNENSACLWYEKKYYLGWVEEGISVKAMRKFDIRWFAPEKHIIIPHRDMNDRLVGIRRRSLNPEDVKYKYMPVRGFEHPLGANLYGIHKIPAGTYEKVYVAEGEKSVLQGVSFGVHNVVATCGSVISPIQVELLKGLGIRQICICFDNDVRYGENGWGNKIFQLAKQVKRIEKTGMVVTAKIDVKKNLLGLKDSPFDRGPEAFHELEEISSETLQKEAGIYEEK